MPIIGVLFAFVSRWVIERVISLAAKIGYSAVLAGLSYLIIALQISVVASTVYIVVWLYTTIQEIFDFVDTQVSGADVDVTFAADVVKSLGIWDGFVDAFNLAVPIFTAILTLKLSLIALKFLSDLHTVISRHINIALSHGV